MKPFQDFKLTDHFWLLEMIQTSHRDIDNMPDDKTIIKLQRTCEKLEKVRFILGNRPILVTNGYRCPELNCVVGGVMTKESLKNLITSPGLTEYGRYSADVRLVNQRFQASDSQHMLGEAVDWHCPSYGSPYEVCCKLSLEMERGLEIDQLIYEYTWIHNSFVKEGSRQQILTLNASTGGYKNGIHAT